MLRVQVCSESRKQADEKRNDERRGEMMLGIARVGKVTVTVWVKRTDG
jgi:hypothetical protein